MGRWTAIGLLSAALSTAISMRAFAQLAPIDEGTAKTITPPTAPPQPTTWSGARSAEAGMFLPLTISARVGSQKAVVSVVSGYDSDRGAVLRASTEIHPWGPFAIMAGTAYGSSSNVQPRVGLRLQLLDQARHHLDLAIGAQYEGAGYEGKPAFQTFLALSRQLGRVGLFANFIYGQEIDETQRHGEVRLAALVRIATPVYAGLDGRVAFDLDAGRTVDAGEVRDLDFTMTVGPTVSYSVRWFSILLQGGATAQRWKGQATQAGGVAVAGFGLTLF